MIMADRMRPLSSYFFAKLNNIIAELSQTGKDIIRLDIGSPDLPPPKAVVEKLYQSASQPSNHGYQSHRGTAAFREAWQTTYARQFNVEIEADSEIMPLMGTKEGIFHLTQLLINPGDVVLIPDPHYPTYLAGTLFAGGKPYFAPLLEENDYLPDLSAIPRDVTKRAKMLWVNYPNNPTGASASLEFFTDLVKWAKESRTLLCADAAYSQVYYEGAPPPSILQVPGAKEVAVEFNSLSKAYNMAGWRVGALVGNPEYISGLLRLKSNVDSGLFGPILDAATCALETDQAWVHDRNQIYRQRRDVVVNGFKEMGIKLKSPQAALYVWVPIPEGQSSEPFAMTLLQETGVSVAPGTIFGEEGEGFIRISIVQPAERLSEAMRRIRDWWPSQLHMRSKDE
jgi:LL-diaminopimelate aminotransferase